MRRKYFIIMLLCTLFVFPSMSQGAGVSLFLDKNFYNIGDEFTVDLKIDSEGVSINAAQATLSYPADILEIKAIDRDESIFNFWLEEPVFNNSTGILTFIGGSSGGYSGRALNIFSVVFGTKKAGTATLSLTQGAVTASDGSGTNVLTAMHGSDLIISEKNAPAPVATSVIAPTTPDGTRLISLPPEILPAPTQITRSPVKVKYTPDAPKIEIPFYPNQDSWYNSIANFLVKWNLPDDISGVATGINTNPKSDPAKNEGLFENKFFPAVDDGVWYIHVSFKNNIGWGDTGHYKISVDTVPPEAFDIKLEGSIDKNGITDNPAPTITYKSADGLSGIAKYSIQIDDKTAIDTQEEKMILPLQKPGKHMIRIAAIDFAGNGTEASIVIDVLPIASPLITSISNELFIGEGGLSIGGTSLPGTVVALALKGPVGEIISTKEVSVSETGGWAAKFEEALKKGAYTVELVAKDIRGAESFVVVSDVIKVRPRPVLSIFGLELTANWFFALVVTILVFGFAAGFVAYYFWRAQLGHRVTIAQRDVASVLNLVQKDIENIADRLGSGTITKQKKEEARILTKRAAENIEKMERYVLENIKQIKD